MPTTTTHAGQPPASINPKRAYRPDIDGLRAIAILAVVLHHAGLGVAPGGFTGVDIFFVISGYLIGGHIYAEAREGAFRFLRFYSRRARRILPAFFAVLVITIAAAMLLLSPAEGAAFGRAAFAAVLSASNLIFWRFSNYFEPRSTLQPLLMTWSLGVEEQFYAVAPLLILLLVKLRRNMLLPVLLALCALSFLLAWFEVRAFPPNAFYLLSSRAWELGAGVILAVFEIAKKPLELPRWAAEIAGCLGLASICAPIVLLHAGIPFPGPSALPSVAGTALLIAVPQNWVNRRILAIGPLRFIGQISYSLYLWHWPLLAFMRLSCGEDLPLSASLIAVCLAFALAIISLYFVEQPFRRSSRAPASLLWRYGACSAALLAACAVIWLSRGLPSRFPVLATMEAAGEPLHTDPCLLGHGSEPNLSAACFPVDSSVVLWGDSHAAALAPALRNLALAQGERLAELAKNSCPPLIGATHYIPRLPAMAADCERFNQSVLNKILSDPSLHSVVLTACWSASLNRDWMDGWLVPDAAQSVREPSESENQSLFLSGLAGAVKALRTAGKSVVLIEDVPGFGFDPMERVRMERIPARRVLAHWVEWPSPAHHIAHRQVNGNEGAAHPERNPNARMADSLVEQAVGQFPEVLLYDPKPSLCQQPDRCIYRDGDRMLYVDSTHVTSEGANRALNNLRLQSP